MLELAILGLLKDLPLHGYELRKRLSETFGHRLGTSYGSLYPALARLERSGAIEAVDPPAAPVGIPSTGSISGEAAAARLRRPLRRGGRTRKAYRLADPGQRLLSELLATDAGDDDRTFTLKLAFCRHMEPPARRQLFARRRVALSQRLENNREALAAAYDADPWTRSLLEHEAATAQHDLGWVEALLAGESHPTTEPVPQGGNP